jgi:hypothetical protein
MDQPTFTPVQRIVERSGTLFFSSQDLDSTKPAGSVKIRVETMAHYLERHSLRIMRQKLARLPPTCPLMNRRSAELSGSAVFPAPAWTRRYHIR